MASESIPLTPPNNHEEEGVVSDQKKKSEKRKIVITEVDIEKEAMDAAEAKMTADKSELKGFRGFCKKIWKHNLAFEYYRQKELIKARKAIQDSGNLYVAEKGDKTDHDDAMKAVVDRFTNEYEEEMIHTEAGEKKKVLSDDAPGEQNLKLKIQAMIGRYAKGEINDEQFSKEKDILFQDDVKKIKGEGGKNVVEKGKMYASNLLEIAKEVRQAVEHGEALNNLDLDFEVIVGKANVGVRTENNFSSVDKVIDKIQKSKLGMVFANETAIALGVAGLYSVLVKGSVSTAQKLSKLLGPLGLGISAGVGGAVAMTREGKRVQEERTQHSRDMAKGKSFEKNAERRTEMEKYRHETKGAGELAENLEKSLGLLDEKDGKSIKAVLAHLNEIEARISLSDQKSIDLIQYSDAKKIEQERMQLDLVRAKAKVELRKINGGNIKNVKGEDVPLKEYLEGIKDARIDDFSKEKTIKDEAFHKFRQKKMTGAFVKGMIVGASMGAVIQEGGAFLGISGSEGLLSTKESFAANGAPEVHHYTALGSLKHLYRYVMGDLPRMNASQMHEEVFGNNHFKLPVGVDFHKNANGSFDLLRNGNPIAKGLTLDQNGHLTNEAHQILKDENILASDSTQQISSGGTKEIIHSPKEYVKNHENLFEKIKRGSWADNDTLKPDKNELKLWWGGEKGTGIDSNGKYVFNMKHMIPTGSSHAGTHWNPEELLKEGKMKLLISLSEDSQNQVVEIPIDANGNAIIDPNSEIGKIAFENVNGHAKFLGRFAEVAVFDGQKDGVDVFNPLATYGGKGLADWKETIVTPGEEISTTILDIPAENTVDWPYAIPVLGRNPLERTTSNDVYISGYFKEDSKNRKFYRERQSESLKKPDTDLDSYDEIENYFKRQPKDWLDKIQGLSSQINEPMDAKCKVAICIPAAGHQEEKNIYKTLELYKSQQDKDGSELNNKLYEIIVFVNYPKDKKPDGTLSEIERFKKDNPNIPVKILHKQLEREETKIGTIRKYATDVALIRQQQKGREAEDLIIISNDADCSGMSEKYIASFIDRFDNNSKTDAVLGRIDWDTEAYTKYPLIHIGTRFFQYIDVIYRHHKDKSKKGVGSSGANFAFKGSMYAAVGGYIENDRIAEDKHLGEMIKYARKNTSRNPIEYGGDKSGIITNARRAVDALKKGLSPSEQWSTEFGPDDTLRELEWNLEENEDVLEKLDDKEYQEQFMQILQKFINRTLRVYELSPKSWEAKRALGFLGIEKYEIQYNENTDRDEVIFTNPDQLSKLIEGLKKYQLNNKV